MRKLAKHLRRFSIRHIKAVKAVNPDLAKLLWQMREGRGTRYANKSFPSQRQRRKAARRLQIFP